MLANNNGAVSQNRCWISSAHYLLFIFLFLFKWKKSNNLIETPTINKNKLKSIVMHQINFSMALRCAYINYLFVCNARILYNLFYATIAFQSIFNEWEMFSNIMFGFFFIALIKKQRKINYFSKNRYEIIFSQKLSTSFKFVKF